MISQLAVDIPMAPESLLANAEVLDGMLTLIYQRTQMARQEKRQQGLTSRIKRAVRRG